ncbi:succinate-semialdehyde dehydrogenase (NADP(+)) [Rhodococcus spelaei]|uniref:Succinate-semialdehyde dehydrogenase (NADP(+)) n=1 Tax=Rhodococcus spelaei TaxID=2546320 RepID=A0A541B407_9NOCA|nr:succinic semialdehyde dehydrogenase [Rhodococcus spelaei]TQF67036.1 succinate-semialdehyde dehydrogenase (NADP(+)) [Rhodococcus spelaei]
MTSVRSPEVGDPPSADHPRAVDPALIHTLRTQLPHTGALRRAAAPFTGQPLPGVPQANPAAVAETARSARGAQDSWARTPIREREAVARRFARALIENHDLLCDLMQWETGKARVHAAIEVQGVISVASYYGRTGAEHLRGRRARTAVPGIVSARVGYRPKGLVGVIAPWNYPLFLAVGDVIPALVAGNAVLSKADSQAPWTLLLARKLAVEAGLPPAVWQVVAGSGAEIGSAVIDAVDYLCFTGSTATGRAIARQCADRLIGASLELGGKNPMIVCADADVDAAATGAVQACFSNAGQMCIGVERIYVHERVYSQFVDAFVGRTRRLRLGSDYTYATDMGSLTSRRQLETTTAHVEDAVAKGATVLTGGRPRPDVGPLFHDPTVLADVTAAMTVYAEETFGPVVSVYRVASEDEAVRLANEGEYGLSASVWTKDLGRGRALARLIVAGAVNVNDGYLSAIAALGAPMGGMRSSGVGRRHGREGIVRYTESQTVTTQRVPTPYPDRMRAGLLRVMNSTTRLKLALPSRFFMPQPFRGRR